MIKKIQGLYTALITPFDSRGQLDEEGLKENIEYQIENDVDGIVILGTTGETPTLSDDEKKRIIRIARDQTRNRVSLIIGTSHNSTTQTVENTLIAKEAGADAAMIVTPYYNKPTQEGIYRHYINVAEAIDLPIVIYNCQSRTGQNIHVSTIQRLAEHERIISIKEASGSIPQMMDIYEKVCLKRPGFTILSGDDSLTLPCMSVGGHGVISVVGNLLPKPMKALVKAIENGDYTLARKLHYQLLPIFNASFIESNPIPIKTAMNYIGMPAGECRLPLCEMQQANLVKLINVLEANRFVPSFKTVEQV